MNAPTPPPGHVPFSHDETDMVQLQALTHGWGHSKTVELYLDRCRVDTPHQVVSALWSQIHRRRDTIGKVVDFGAGDGRFATGGLYREYLGYEIDMARVRMAQLPDHARLLNRCAFSDTINDADVCLGNPPYVRNQDLPRSWRARVSAIVEARTGVHVTGLANAWQYFAFLALASAKSDGIVGLIIPYEWVSRPSAKALRCYIDNHRWSVSVYRLRDETFTHVLTTASITIIDKNDDSGKWTFFAERNDGAYLPLTQPTGSVEPVLPYRSATHMAVDTGILVMRGLSPGTQKVLTLTEAERIKAGLLIGTDVVRCVTSLRSVGVEQSVLSEAGFNETFRDTGAKCWLIRTDRSPSAQLDGYLSGVPIHKRQSSTCRGRDTWWRFRMPAVPAILLASGFKGDRPKALVNECGAMAVGSVSGVHGATAKKAAEIVAALRMTRIAPRVVPHSNGLLKVEVGQWNAIIEQINHQIA